MARILGETGAGETFRSGDAEDFADKLTALLDDRARTSEMARLGLLASERQYDWSYDAEIRASPTPTSRREA